MTRDGGGDSGPYQSATDQNTSTTWLNDMTPVNVNLHGMADFAKNMITISDNLNSHQKYVMGQITSIIEDNAFAGGFPEISYAATLHSRNLSEFANYLSQLWQALQHTGSAAQVIADSYSSTDGWSAASLDAVNFAFGDPNAKRPANLPSLFGKTWSEMAAEQAAKSAASGDQGSGHADSVWQVKSTSTDTSGGSSTVYVDQYGDTRTINVTYQDGKKVTSIVTPQGTTTTTESTYSYPYGSVTTRTTVTPDGKSSTSTVTTYSGGNTYTTTTSDGSGKATSSTTDTYNSDGSQTDTTYSYDSTGKRTTQSQITYGQETQGPGNTVDSPAGDQEKSLQDSMPKDDSSNTKILAPGAPGSTSSSGSTASV